MNDGGNKEWETPEVRGKLLQFHRVLMSYIDFEQAGEIASYILEHNLHDRRSGVAVRKPLVSLNARCGRPPK